MPISDRTPRAAARVRRRVAHATSAWMLVAVLCALGLSGVADPAGAAPTARTQPCATADGVTIIIDYHGQDGRDYVDVVCAPGRPATGLTALADAGIAVRGATRSPSFVCQLDGAPSADPCVNESPASAYWSYWLAPRGSTQWCLSTLGGGGRTPPPGTVDAWSFSKGTTSSTTRPPRVSPPPALPGTPPAAIPASHCSYWRDPAPITAPPVTTPPATAPPATSGPGSGGSTGGGSGSGQSGGGAAPAKPGSPSTPGTPTKPRPSTERGDAGPSGPSGSATASEPEGKGTSSPTTTSAGRAGDDAGDTADDSSEAGGAKPGSDDSAAPGSATEQAADQRFQQELAAVNDGKTRRAVSTDDEKDGSPVPLIFAAVAAAILLGTGIRASRRNRTVS